MVFDSAISNAVKTSAPAIDVTLGVVPHVRTAPNGRRHLPSLSTSAPSSLDMTTSLTTVGLRRRTRSRVYRRVLTTVTAWWPLKDDDVTLLVRSRHWRENLNASSGQTSVNGLVWCIGGDRTVAAVTYFYWLRFRGPRVSALPNGALYDIGREFSSSSVSPGHTAANPRVPRWVEGARPVRQFLFLPHCLKGDDA